MLAFKFLGQQPNMSRKCFLIKTMETGINFRETPMYKKYHETIEGAKISTRKPEFQELYARKEANARAALDESNKYEAEMRKYKTQIRVRFNICYHRYRTPAFRKICIGLARKRTTIQC